jgi:hypothetical protein
MRSSYLLLLAALLALIINLAALLQRVREQPGEQPPGKVLKGPRPALLEAPGEAPNFWLG